MVYKKSKFNQTNARNKFATLKGRACGLPFPSMDAESRSTLRNFARKRKERKRKEKRKAADSERSISGRNVERATRIIRFRTIEFTSVLNGTTQRQISRKISLERKESRERNPAGFCRQPHFSQWTRFPCDHLRYTLQSSILMNRSHDWRIINITSKQLITNMIQRSLFI